MIGGSGASHVPLTSPSSALRSRFNFRSLRPIRVRNPDAHERDLLDRIRLYEEQMAQRDLFEADRQRSFDDMERNRAGMFAAMNGQLAKQRKEIHRLRKLHENASLDSSLTTRASHNQSVGPAVSREEGEGLASVRRHSSHSPMECCLTAVPTSTQSFPNMESFNDVDDVDEVAGASLSERDSLVLNSAHLCHLASSAIRARVCSLQEELRWHEKVERLLVWREAMECTVQLAAVLHAITVRSCTEELAACHAKLLGEREAFTSGLEALQLQNEVLGAQLADLEAKLHASSEAAEADQTAQANAEVEEQKCAASASVGRYLLDCKALCTARLAMNMYGSVAAHYSILLHKVGSSSVSDELHGDLDGLAMVVTRDLAEVHATLGSLKKQGQEVLQAPHVSPSVASPILVDPSTLQLPPPSCVVAAAADIPEHRCNASGAVRRFRSSSSSVSSLHRSSHGAPAGPVADQEIHRTTASLTDTSTTCSEEGDAGVHPSANAFSGDATAASVWQDDLRGCSLDRVSMSRNKDRTRVQSDSRAGSSEGHPVDDHAGEALARVSADEADSTAASSFSDCVETDERAGRLSMTPEDAGAMTPTGAVSEDGDDFEGLGGASPAAPVYGEREESNEKEEEDVLTPPPEPSSHMTAEDSTDADAQDGSQADTNDPAVETFDSDTLRESSQLTVTEAEEAELLAQLKKEIEKDGAAALVEPEEEEAQTALAGKSFSASSDEEVEGEEMTGTESCHLEDGSEEESDGQVAVAVPAALSAATTSGEEQPDGPVALEALGEMEPAPFAGRIPQVTAEAGGTPSIRGDNGEPDASLPLPLKREKMKGEPEWAFPSALTNLSAVPPSSTGATNGVAQETVDAPPGVVEALEATAIVAAPPLPPAANPTVIPPTSLDEFFGGCPNAAPLPPPPADAPPNAIQAPAALYAASPPPSVPPGTNKPASLYAALNNGTPMPSLSPSSMFATPPRPAPSQPFFARFSSDGNFAQPQSGAKGASSRGLSSSPDDEFEAGFDPFV
ncbi:hypothetical protein ABL78_7931 [Leptomonas seymouri]|uniref:Uncharacterized protein n=1 Tax=Leptomonas seymouri TaxID=5684 RepID=A0A0N1HRQ9_LEPSE|nr:hypothetical protein ABL78_7931 [Leptomonas seymouri]|eukprot:KPI83052.1 hypothetical protein ABL78_7931 [Leptomonas seymouri]